DRARQRSRHAARRGTGRGHRAVADGARRRRGAHGGPVVGTDPRAVVRAPRRELGRDAQPLPGLTGPQRCLGRCVPPSSTAAAIKSSAANTSRARPSKRFRAATPPVLWTAWTTRSIASIFSPYVVSRGKRDTYS